MWEVCRSDVKLTATGLSVQWWKRVVWSDESHFNMWRPGFGGVETLLHYAFRQLEFGGDG